MTSTQLFPDMREIMSEEDFACDKAEIAGAGADDFDPEAGFQG